MNKNELWEMNFLKISPSNSQSIDKTSRKKNKNPNVYYSMSHGVPVPVHM